MKRQRTILLFLIATLLGGRHAFAQMTPDAALSKFVEAGMAYQKEDYDTAIAKYAEILSGGRESGAVYYNLGNSYFRKGNIGRAVLNYERAKKLIPRDSDLHFNDRYIRAKIDRYESGPQEGFLDRGMDRFIGFYTNDEMALILTAVMFILAGIFLLSLYLHWPKTWTYSAISILFLIGAVYGLGLAVKVQQNKDLAVVLTATEAFFEPRTDSTVYFKLLEGMRAKVSRVEGDWMKVQRLDGKVGWVSKDALEKI